MKNLAEDELAPVMSCLAFQLQFVISIMHAIGRSVGWQVATQLVATDQISRGHSRAQVMNDALSFPAHGFDFRIQGLLQLFQAPLRCSVCCILRRVFTHTHTHTHLHIASHSGANRDAMATRPKACDGAKLL